MGATADGEMWGDQAPTQPVRDRMKLLLEIHQRELQPRERTAEPGELLLAQGQPADRVLLLTAGRVAIEVRQLEATPHTLAVVEAEDLLGEMGLFGTGRHSADVRAVDGPVRYVEVPGDGFLRTLLFDGDLAMELLTLVCQRCTRSNEVIGLLLDGIAAAHRGDRQQLGRITAAIAPLDHCLGKAADRLEQLGG
ncbi:MAG: cyclic nucleotide-binding domain-containing protein [Cyanobacteriota bacterium]|nr:cyclic nucleotide-binding domain-containing protein [Cyanobacteriota bacterium]